jgi:ATP-dependent Lhr-like helicase
MNSAASSSDRNPFSLLHEGIQRWIWSRGWTVLRSVQQRAIPALIDADRDVILAAATSTGKTEAAFFPILTNLLQQDHGRFNKNPGAPSQTASPFEVGDPPGFVLSISPLKALINDQAQRLTAICEPLELPVLGWHGDIPASRKQRFLKELSGVLILTPESLEAMFVTRGSSIPAIAARVRYIVVDELHSFLDTERGKQVQSLMTRLEIAAGHGICRVGLSATLGDTSLAAEFLRPGASERVQVIAGGDEAFELKLVVKGYTDDWDMPLAHPEPVERAEDDDDAPATERRAGSAKLAIANYLYDSLRGTNNLIFPNTRTEVEYYADRFRRLCERDAIPNEFWAHHGSLSRDLREDAETALKDGQRPATAVCTTTLELGIDIGSVRSVAQIGPPPSVASLRQRLGRSGRRAGEPAILRCFAIERKLSPRSSFSDRLREGLLQTVAMVRLLLEGWVEPPRASSLHASTFVQQILSVIAQRGGATAAELWSVLVASGTFPAISREDFVLLLRNLGTLEILQQESSGLLLPAPKGEKLIGYYGFYSAFATGEEYRVLAEGRQIGTIPIARPLTVGQRIIFAGRRWRVMDVDTERRTIYVRGDRGGSPPAFEGAGSMVHRRVQQQMRLLLEETAPVTFLDQPGNALLEEARAFYRSCGLAERRWIPDGSSLLIPLWCGDWTKDALALLLTARGLEASNEGIALRVEGKDEARLEQTLRAIADMPTILPEDLKLTPRQTFREKWDWLLPDRLRLHSYASAALDLQSVRAVAEQLCTQNAPTA